MLTNRVRRSIATVLGLSLLTLLAAAPVSAHVENVTGTITLRERVQLSPLAVAVVTLTDRSPNGAGTIIGQQRIDGATGAAIPFSVPYDADEINNKHAYSVYASVTDAGSEWQSLAPVPTITGGPTEGLSVEVVTPAYTTPASITGTITLPDDTTLSPTAVAYAAIINTTSGRMVVRQTIPSPTSQPIPFTINYDADLVDPEATYSAIGAVIDGAVLWQSPGTAVEPGATLTLATTKSDQTIPAPGASTPPESLAPSTEPSAQPTTVVSEPPATGEPTAKPPKTPKPTAEPTAAPTEAPTAAPATPAATATAEPTAEVPTLSPAPTVEPTSFPTSVSGTLVYREGAQLTDAAVASIAVVQVIGRNGTVVVIGKVQMDNPGQVPIAFDVPLDQAALDPTVDAELWAIITDGDRAWITSEGVAVATNGAPSQGVVVPLTFRADLLEGEVTGNIVGAGPDLSTDAIAITWVLNASTLAIVGFDDVDAYGLDPIPFAVAFSVTDLDPNQGYIATSFVYDGESQWTNQVGVPVITNGNPIADVTVTVEQLTPFATATPGLPTPSPIPTPAATPAPPPASGGMDPLWILLIVLVVGGGIGAVVLLNRRQS